MPVRVSVTGVETWQLALSIILLFGTAAAIIWIAAKIYRVAIFASTFTERVISPRKPGTERQPSSTRRSPELVLGASPRATLHLVRAARDLGKFRG